MLPLLTGWLVALVLGLRHATEPDHLAAVSTLLAEHRDPRGGTMLGMLWGLGHAATLCAVGGALLVLHGTMTRGAADGFELVVAVMLLALGVRALLGAARGHARPHDAPARTRPGAAARARQPILVGVIHGLAGSGALTALALANMPSVGAGLVFLALFGVGSVAGMAAVTGLAGWPLRRLVHYPRAHAALRIAAGAGSLAMGLAWGWAPAQRLLVA